jgi:molybdopterin molybdotransferase
VFALPGRPVPTLVCLARYVLPALFISMGETPAAREKIALGGAVEVKSKLTSFVPIRAELDEWGRAWALPCSANGSGELSAFGGTDGFVELPPGPNNYAKGFVTRIFRW